MRETLRFRIGDQVRILPSAFVDDSEFHHLRDTSARITAVIVSKYAPGPHYEICARGGCAEVYEDEIVMDVVSPEEMTWTTH